MYEKDIDNLDHYRSTILIRETKKSIPSLVIIVLLVLGYYTIIVVGKTNRIETSRGVGNPYNCIKCKDLGFACNDHKGYDTDKELERKLERYTYNFVPGGSEKDQKQWLYGSDYNTKCDFCKNQKSECYSDKYDREIINSTLQQIVTDEVFKTKLNDSDWQLGYPNTSDGRAMLYNEVKNRFRR